MRLFSRNQDHSTSGSRTKCFPLCYENQHFSLFLLLTGNLQIFPGEGGLWLQLRDVYFLGPVESRHCSSVSLGSCGCGLYGLAGSSAPSLSPVQFVPVPRLSQCQSPGHMFWLSPPVPWLDILTPYISPILLSPSCKPSSRARPQITEA